MLRFRRRAGLGILILPVAFFGWLVSYGRRSHPHTTISLVDAAKSENMEAVRSQIEAGASANSLSMGGHSALYEAAENGDSAMVAYLLEHGASPNGDSNGKNTALDAAAMAGNLTIVQALVAKGANLRPPSSDGETPLHAAASGGNKSVVSFLLDRGLDANARRTIDHATPICDAASAGHWDCIELLNSRGGKIDIGGYHGRTPLSLTILRRHRDVARKLVDAGADVNIADADRTKPLTYAIIIGDFDLAKQLLEKTKNAGEYGRGGHNALYYAASYNAPLELVQALFQAGCKNEQKTSGTALDAAEDNGNQSLISWLKKMGAKD